MRGFAIIDVETTGLNSAGYDRIVELAIVHADDRGNITDRFETLLNPNRDLGPQRIHGVRAADVLDAPSFGQIVPDFVELLSGRVLVAHNASFDSRFVRSEFERAGHEVWGAPEWLCTMQLARVHLPGSGRSLIDCCSAYDIEIKRAHRALDDADATARLLAAYIGSSHPDAWEAHLVAAHGFRWPSLGALSGRAGWKPRPERTVETTADTFLARITTKLPELSGPPEHSDYLALLDMALIDRHISHHEANALVALAEDLGISRSTIASLHLTYFESLVQVAWSDGVLTDLELVDLLAVADLLDLPMDSIASAGERPEAATPTAESFSLVPGDVVVLTGDMTRPRETIEAELRAHGLVPWGAVTKKVKLVVAADPDSLSGKAKKARDYGIPVVGEHALSGLLGGV